ncbi:MAG: TIGR02099 family protein [Betaproteobacteria bacterium]|nr:TIGR02099 family protein [Betaproteobacteria bacterium]
MNAPAPDASSPESLSPPDRASSWRRLTAALSAVNRKGGSKILRVLGAFLLVVYFVFAISILVLRYAILPTVDNHREEIAARIGETLGLPVTIGRIESSWHALSPDLILFDVRLDDRKGRPALAFSRVEAELSWTSLLHGTPILSFLSIDEPALHIRREADGHIFVAGIAIDEKGEDSGVGNWILQQRQIRIRGATLVWEDARRSAPPLVLDNVNFALDNRGFRHRFSLSALPPRELAARLDLRGELVGEDFAGLAMWRGALFTQLDYTDLSAWRPWTDYPVRLPQGVGGVRAWISLEGGTLSEAVADVRLRDVHLQLAQNLPQMDLKSLEGRLAFAANETGHHVSAQGLSMQTLEDLRLDPTDFSVSWTPLDPPPDPGTKPARHAVPEPAPENPAPLSPPRWRGTAEISRVDLSTLGALAAYLPLDEKTRGMLRDFAPTGQIYELRAAFSGNPEAVEHYALSAGFARLGWRARGKFPGLSDFSGSVNCDETKGSMYVRSANARIEMPGVFDADPLRFDRINGLVRWAATETGIEVEFPGIAFANADLRGEAQGHYVHNGSGPGTIDLTATLPYANGAAIWRYMPRAVNPNATVWLKRSIAAGVARDTRLTLRGDLARFPFSDGSGTFHITSRATGVRLDFAPDWPPITNLDAKMTFSGVTMTIESERGNILGTTLGKTRAEIPNLDSDHAELNVAGEVHGTTMEFFKFIAQSPVRQTVGDLTQDLRAKGGGTLALKLGVPLEHSIDTRVQGNFLFADNELVFDPALPPLTAINGHLLFTESMVAVKEIKARFLNGPALLHAETKDGQAELTVEGSLAIPELQRELRRSAEGVSFSALSGKIDWKVTAGLKKKLTRLVIESNLAGLVSTLPEPFAKTANAALPLRLEKIFLPAQGSLQRAQWLLTLGKIANAALFYYQTVENGAAQNPGSPGRMVIAAAISDKAASVLPPLPALPPLPERGLAVDLAASRLNLTAWRNALEASGANSRPGASALPDLRLHLKTPELVMFGRRLHQAELALDTPARNIWEMRINSREAEGNLRWDGEQRGALYARMKKFTLEPAEQDEDSDSASALRTLPALDIIADEFQIGRKKLGHLELRAENGAQTWRIRRLVISNPDGRLEGEGLWKMSAPQQVSLDFSLSADDAGKMLDRLDYPGTLKNGAARLQGALRWNGVPVSIDFPSLSGSMRLEAQKGQFAKLDPGAARLLGLISLQALPRRISLDFGDIFSSGFAFDSINGDFALSGGLIHTDELVIKGPAALVRMYGNADLARETQDLTVDIQPELSTTAALGVALVNPIAGAVTLLANKVFQDPLNQIFAFSYHVTGAWDDPKVEKQPFTAKKPNFETPTPVPGQPPSAESPGAPIPSLPDRKPAQ